MCWYGWPTWGWWRGGLISRADLDGKPPTGARIGGSYLSLEDRGPGWTWTSQPYICPHQASSYIRAPHPSVHHCTAINRQAIASFNSRVFSGVESQAFSDETYHWQCLSARRPRFYRSEINCCVIESQNSVQNCVFPLSGGCFPAYEIYPYLCI